MRLNNSMTGADLDMLICPGLGGLPYWSLVGSPFCMSEGLLTCPIVCRRSLIRTVSFLSMVSTCWCIALNLNSLLSTTAM